MLEIKDVDILISTCYLIKSLSFTLHKHDKLAIIGEEGNGKSTLLKALLGICPYAKVTGIIDLKGHRVGYLKQSLEETEKTVFSFLFVDETDYCNKINHFYQWVKELGLHDVILNQSIHTLSGGEKVKVGLLKLLLDEFDILFLDEPTNDLDIETLDWLERFIVTLEKPIIFVSHDETLLSHTANMILHLEQIKRKQECKHTIVKMNYDDYVNWRMSQIQKQAWQAKYEKRQYNKKKERLNQIMQKVEYQQNTITRADPHGAKVLKKKMKTLKTQERKLEMARVTERPDIEENIYFSFENSVFLKSKLIRFMIPELKIENHVLAHNIKLEIGNSHVCIVGKNGSGKTTFMKKIYQELKNRTDMKVGYMPQNYDDVFKNSETVLDFLGLTEQKDITKAYMYLGNMNFTRTEMTGKIKELSKGTQAKLILAKMVIEQCNVLLLDEPTRNVSPLSNPVIRTVLKNFKGTIISVSHDRKYIDEVIDEVYILTKNGLVQKI